MTVTAEDLAKRGVRVKPIAWELRADPKGVHYSGFCPVFQTLHMVADEGGCDLIEKRRSARILAALECTPAPEGDGHE